MAVAEIRPDWTVGTLTLVGGNKDFTTTGSALETAAIQAGDEIITQSGLVLIIASITGQNAGTLMENCPADAAGADQPLRIRFQPDGSRYNGAVADLVQLLGSGNVYAFAGLNGEADKLPMFSGAGTLTLIDRLDLVSGVKFNALVDTLADRDAYDNEVAGFIVMVADVGDGRSAIYFKNSMSPADWSDAAYVTGPAGGLSSIEVGATTTLPAGSSATVVNSGTQTEPVLDFGIPAGVGFYSKGDYSAAAQYNAGDVVQYNGSSFVAVVATQGNQPPTPPATGNAYWNLLAKMGEGGDMFKAVYDPTNQSRDIFAAIDGVNTGIVTPESFGAVGDGVSDDTNAVQSAVDFVQPLGSIFLGDNKKYKTTSPILNKYGVKYFGKGIVFYGGNVVSTTANTLPVNIGGEYLAAFAASQSSSINGVGLFGDSTVSLGNGESGQSVTDIVKAGIEELGFKSAIRVSNYAVGGTVVSQMNAVSKIGVDNNKLFVIKYGINDGGLPISTRLETFANDLRAKLSEIRSAPNGGVHDLSILLISPTSAFDDAANKNEYWMEQLRGVFISASRDYKCAFFDAYTFAKDNRSGSGMNAWMLDTLHPNWTSYEPLWVSICRFIGDHTCLGSYRRSNGIYSIPNSARDVSAAITPSVNPSAFPLGITINRCLTTDGWPRDGSVVTIKHVDGPTLQTVYPWNPSGKPSLISRNSGGSEGFWSQWSGVSNDITLQNGWGNLPGFAKITYRNDGVGGVHISGTATGGSVAVGTTVLQVPSHLAPSESMVFSGVSQSGYCSFRLNPDGNLNIHDFPPASGWICISISYPAK